MSRVGNRVNPLLGGTDLSTVIEENPRKTSGKSRGSGLNLYFINFELSNYFLCLYFYNL